MLSLGLILQMVINKTNSVGLQKLGAKGAHFNHERERERERERFGLKEIFRVRLDTVYFAEN